MNFSQRILRLPSYLAVPAILLSLAAVAFAHPLQSENTGNIISLEPEKAIYVLEDEVIIELRFENIGDLEQSFKPEIEILSPSGKIVYESVEQGPVGKITLDPGESAARVYRWIMPAKT